MNAAGRVNDVVNDALPHQVEEEEVDEEPTEAVSNPMQLAKSPNDGFVDLFSLALRNDLETYVSCPECASELDEPKLLACGHSLCVPCAGHLTTRPYRYGDTFEIICPVCTTKSTVLQSGLKTNYPLKNFIAMLKRLKKEVDRKKCSSCNSAASKFYVCSCDGASSSPTKEICANCVLASHRTHEAKLVREAWIPNEVDSLATGPKNIRDDFTAHCDKLEGEMVSDAQKVTESHRDQVDAAVDRIERLLHVISIKAPLKSDVRAMVEDAKTESEIKKESLRSYMTDFDRLIERHTRKQL